MKRVLPLHAAVAAVSLVLSTPASAVLYYDDTTGGPTFDRAVEDFSGLSSVGTDVAFHAYGFSVTVTGNYRVRSYAGDFFLGETWNQFIFLYQGRFDPDQPLLDGVTANDDFKVVGRSGFDVALSAGMGYFIVTTGFASGDHGDFHNTIHGPGDVIPGIPEPETYALLATGLGAVVLAARRRRRGLRDL
jgi:hypothetical protein